MTCIIDIEKINFPLSLEGEVFVFSILSNLHCMCDALLHQLTTWFAHSAKVLIKIQPYFAKDSIIPHPSQFIPTAFTWFWITTPGPHKLCEWTNASTTNNLPLGDLPYRKIPQSSISTRTSVWKMCSFLTDRVNPIIVCCIILSIRYLCRTKDIDQLIFWGYTHFIQWDPQCIFIFYITRLFFLLENFQNALYSV